MVSYLASKNAAIFINHGIVLLKKNPKTQHSLDFSMYEK